MRRRGDRYATWLGAFAVLALLVAGVLAGSWCAHARLAAERARPAAPGGQTVAGARAAARDDPAAAVANPHVTGVRGAGARAVENARADAAGDAAVLGSSAGLGVVLAGFGVLWVCGRVRERRRSAEWDAQWARLAPRWMRQY
jgi:hypothetical protein